MSTSYPTATVSTVLISSLQQENDHLKLFDQELKRRYVDSKRRVARLEKRIKNMELELEQSRANSEETRQENDKLRNEIKSLKSKSKVGSTSTNSSQVDKLNQDINALTIENKQLREIIESMDPSENIKDELRFSQQGQQKAVDTEENAVLSQPESVATDITRPVAGMITLSTSQPVTEEIHDPRTPRRTIKRSITQHLTRQQKFVGGPTIEPIGILRPSEDTIEDSDDEQNISAGIFKVEKILDRHRLDDGRMEYFLKWLGFPSSENSWEPENNLNCYKMIKAFNKKMNRKERKKDDDIVTDKLPSPNSDATDETIDTVDTIVEEEEVLEPVEKPVMMLKKKVDKPKPAVAVKRGPAKDIYSANISKRRRASMKVSYAISGTEDEEEEDEELIAVSRPSKSKNSGTLLQEKSVLHPKIRKKIQKKTSQFKSTRTRRQLFARKSSYAPVPSSSVTTPLSTNNFSKNKPILKTTVEKVSFVEMPSSPEISSQLKKSIDNIVSELCNIENDNNVPVVEMQLNSDQLKNASCNNDGDNTNQVPTPEDTTNIVQTDAEPITVTLVQEKPPIAEQQVEAEINIPAEPQIQEPEASFPEPETVRREAQPVIEYAKGRKRKRSSENKKVAADEQMDQTNEQVSVFDYESEYDDNKIPIGRFKCNYANCNKYYDHKRSMVRHRQAEHEGFVKYCQVDGCDRSTRGFKEVGHYNRHMKTHNKRTL